MNSRAKGKRGELELARTLREHGYTQARRGQQYNGIDGQDVVGLDRIHIECKRVQHLNLQDAYDQSRRDAKPGEIPTVMHRRDHCDWLVTLRLEDWIPMYTSWLLDHDDGDSVPAKRTDGADHNNTHTSH